MTVLTSKDLVIILLALSIAEGLNEDNDGLVLEPLEVLKKHKKLMHELIEKIRTATLPLGAASADEALTKE